PIAAAFFRALDPAMEITLLAQEGDAVAPGAELMRLAGNARALLTAERSALNTVQHLCGIATLTRTYVEAMGPTRSILLDTRKTLRSEEHTSELQSRENLVCRLLLEKKK